MRFRVLMILTLAAIVLGSILLLIFAGEEQGAKPAAGQKSAAAQLAGSVAPWQDPELMARVAQGGAFGGEFSRLVAMDIFGRSPQAIRDMQDRTRIVEVAPRSWLIRMPIVNAVLFETDEGLVLVDTGMPAAGPAILTAMRSLSDKPLHTVIYTHGHVDHAYGTRAFLDAGENPEIIAHDNLPQRFERYLRLRGSIAKYMGQPLESLPRHKDDLVWPTRTFSERLELEIGGETFILQHHRGETDDQLYVWVPGRRALASADYYQGFLPNAGNGKRVQRHPEEWAAALREMAELGAEHLLPAHGAEITGNGTAIRRQFLLLAEALQSIVDQTLSNLNRGLPQDEVYRSVELPEYLAEEHTLREQYVSVEDIAKMVMRRHTGWWDDVPSHWSSAPMEERARELARLAGGAERLALRAQELIEKDIRLASHLADWAWYAEPNSAEVQKAVLAVYRARILHPESNTMEITSYLAHMSRVYRRGQKAAKK